MFIHLINFELLVLSMTDFKIKKGNKTIKNVEKVLLEGALNVTSLLKYFCKKILNNFLNEAFYN